MGCLWYQVPLLRCFLLLCLYLGAVTSVGPQLPYTELFDVDPVCPELKAQWLYTKTMVQASQRLYNGLADRERTAHLDTFRMKNAHLVSGFSSFDYYGRKTK